MTLTYDNLIADITGIWPRDKEDCSTNLKLFSVIIVGGSVGIVILRLTHLLWAIRQGNNYIGIGK